MRVAGGERASAATGFATHARIPPRQGRQRNWSDAIDPHVVLLERHGIEFDERYLW